MAKVEQTSMRHIELSEVKIGDSLPAHIQGPISRTTLALFAGASNDHVRFHIDSDVAKEAGMPDVIAHGMLSMAYLAQLLTRWVPQERVLHWGGRFTAITPLHATVHCAGEVIDVFECDGARRARVSISTETGEGLQTFVGEAVIALD